MDYFSKYHVLFPLKEKTVDEVASLLEERVLAYFAPPKIFYSDNGRELVNQVIKALFSRWEGDTTFISGRPRHSQSQGLVERGNRTVEKMIAAMKQEANIDDDTMQYPWAIMASAHTGKSCLCSSIGSAAQSVDGCVMYRCLCQQQIHRCVKMKSNRKKIVAPSRTKRVPLTL